MSEAQETIQKLFEANPIREPVLRSAIRALRLPAGSRGLDAGCGIGLQTLLLAKAVGPAGHVTGLDIMPDLLKVGEELAAEAGLSDRTTFQEGSFQRLPFADNAFDWVWSADCIGYPIGDLAPVLQELARVVKPGGTVALLAWTSQQVLPGYPLLEARLNASCSSYLPYLKGQSPDAHFLRAPKHFREAGFEEVQVQTMVGDLQSPLADGERTALASLFEMLWGQPQPGVSPEDWQEYQRLCAPGSADFILDAPGYYAFFTYTMISGRVS